jgi:hypothetical protein
VKLRQAISDGAERDAMTTDATRSNMMQSSDLEARSTHVDGAEPFIAVPRHHGPSAWRTAVR